MTPRQGAELVVSSLVLALLLALVLLVASCAWSALQ